MGFKGRAPPIDRIGGGGTPGGGDGTSRFCRGFVLSSDRSVVRGIG